MRTRVRLIWLPLLVLVAGCDSCHDQPSSPSPVITQPPVVVTPPVPTPVPVSCSQAAPTEFRITSGERVNDRWKNLIAFEPVQDLTAYTLDLRSRDAVTLQVSLSASAFAQFERYDIGSGVWTGSLHSTCPGASSAVVEFSNGCGPTSGCSVPPPTVPKCTGGHGCSR